MTAAEAIRHQRSEGSVLLRTGPLGLIRMREAGSSKVRFPFRGNEAILINTSGGLAGGDRASFNIGVEADTRLTVTTQAAERVYCSLGPAAEMDVKLTAATSATLHWLPQETILFDGAALSRRINVDLAPGARFLAVESVIMGRKAMGETVAHAALRDRWRIHSAGRLIHADDLAFDGAPPVTRATLGNAMAFATIALVRDRVETLLDPIRAVVGECGSASAWNGKLVARLAASDGFELRKALIPALSVLVQGDVLPKVWSM
ncbi:MAG: urease accessory protein UreD [Alphaproteobacteria bacterium]|nr:urease accessory protein UreD [Alphaproteobacteria bacterium]